MKDNRNDPSYIMTKYIDYVRFNPTPTLWDWAWSIQGTHASVKNVIVTNHIDFKKYGEIFSFNIKAKTDHGIAHFSVPYASLVNRDLRLNPATLFNTFLSQKSDFSDAIKFIFRQLGFSQIKCVNLDSSTFYLKLDE